MLRRYEVTDEQWALIADLFPASGAKGGRPFRDHRLMVNAMFWVLHAGSPWRDLPERYGPWQTAYNRFRRWRDDGTFDRLLDRLRLRLDREGRIEWDAWCADSSVIRAHFSAAGGGKGGRARQSRPTTRSAAAGAGGARS